MKHYLTQNLNDHEKKAVQQLRKNGEANGTAYKLDLNYLEETKHSQHLLLWEADQLKAYACLSSFDPSELEVTMMFAEPEKDFQQLMQLIEEYSRQQALATFMLIIDHSEATTTALAAAAGGIKTFSELYLTLAFTDFAKAADTSRTSVSLTKAVPADKEQLGRFLNDGEPFEIADDDLARTLLYWQEGELAAALRVDEVDGHVGIYGFVVKSSLRGQGLGRKVLISVLNELWEKQPKTIFLEVETENRNARHLYETLGFIARNQFDYFEFSTLE